MFRHSNLKIVINQRLNGDKIKLDQECLTALLDMHHQQEVLSFRIQFRKLLSYCTVLEYTASPGTIEVGVLHSENLNVKDGDIIQIESISLEKCRAAVLKPLSSNYLQIEDLRSVLESHLRQFYATLYKGQKIQVGFGRNDMVEFRVESLEPADACICLNTDIEIDINPGSDSMALSALQAKMNVNGTAKDWITVDGISRIVFDRLKIDSSAVLKLPLVTQISKYRVDLKIHSGDANVYISDNETPSITDHLVLSVEKGSRLFEIDATLFKEGFLYIALEKYGMECECSLVIETCVSNDPDTTPDPIVSVDAPKDMEKCDNCHLLVPSRTLTMHFAYCSRNNQPCPVCHKVFLKKDYPNHWHCEQCSKVGDVAEKDKHMQFFHQFVTCSCGETLYPQQVAQHKKVDCIDRFIICRFCHLLLPAGRLSRTAKDLILGLGLTEHESECGARTFVCQSCSKSVQLKDMQIHLKTHEIMRQNMPVIPFVLCKNQICGNPQNENYLNPLQLCTLCFKPFWSARYDETNQRVPQKIIETYHHQLTVGCERQYCCNPYCCTSLDKSICKDGPLLPNDSAVIAVSQFKSSAIVNPKNPVYYLCNPDPILQRRILLAKRLQEMCNSMYRLEYCVKSLMESREDITSANNWLSKNAPKQ